LTPAATTVILHHGTTLLRARAIEANGPNPKFIEPGGGSGPRAEGFSTWYANGPVSPFGDPDMYARGKAANFPAEGGPAILEIELPQWIVDIVMNDPCQRGTAQSGDVRFESGYGLDELLVAWPSLLKRVLPI